LIASQPPQAAHQTSPNRFWPPPLLYSLLHKLPVPLSGLPCPLLRCLRLKVTA